jgi:hypothetical protein
MWCRWCGGFGVTDLMVCADSECMIKDMNQGASLNLDMGSVTINVSGTSKITSHEFSMAWNTAPEDFFKNLTIN